MLFAALHLNPWQLISAFFLGVTFGWFYLRTGSVPLCVLAHATANGLSIVATQVRLDIPGLTGTPDYAQVVFQPWWLDLSGLLLLLAGVWGFLQSTRQSVAAQQVDPPSLASEIINQSSQPGPHEASETR